MPIRLWVITGLSLWALKEEALRGRVVGRYQRNVLVPLRQYKKERLTIKGNNPGVKLGGGR